MRHFRLPGLGALLLALLVATSTGRAQRGLPIDRLPEDTYAFLVWHGQAAVTRGPATNNLVRMWNDPEFQSIRKALTERLTGSTPASTGDKPAAPPMSAADREAIADVLLSPAIVGLAGPFSVSRLTAGAPPETIAKDFFLIADATGREAQWRRLDELAAKNAGADQPIRGMVGTWRVQAGRQALFDDLTARLKAAAAPASALTSTPLYAGAQKFRAENTVLEYFLKMPDLSSPTPAAGGGPFDAARAKPAAASSFDVAAFLRGMHLERVQGFAGSVGLVGESTLVRTTLLGDTSVGSVFDFFGTSTTTFGTLPAAPAGYSYSASKVDLGALYKTVRGALQSAMPAEQFANIEMMEGMAAAELQMSIADLLGSFDEIATVTPQDAVSTDIEKTMFMLRVKRPKELLALIKQAGSDMIQNESVEGTTTYLTLATPVSAIQVAVTPQLFVAGASRDLVRAAIARTGAPAAAPPAGSLAADADFRRRRTLLPAALTSLSYSDLTKFPWQTFIGQLDSALAAEAKSGGAQTPPPTDVLKRLPTVLSRYFHSSASGSWKAPSGVFFEVRVD